MYIRGCVRLTFSVILMDRVVNYQSFFILVTLTHLTSICVLKFICNNEPTGQAFRFIYSFMTRTAEQTLFMFSATVTAEELYMQGLGKTKL